LNKGISILPYEALKFIRPFVKISSTIAPKLTGNLAFKLFCRPERVDNLDSAQKKLISSAQERIGQAITERVVLLLHGWSGRAAFMSNFIGPLLESGFDILLVDLPGHGESTGNELHIPLALTALNAVHERFGPWHSVIAHSFGGAIALAMVAGAMSKIPPISVNRIVLIATPHSVPDLFNWFSQTIGLTTQGKFWLKENVKRLSGNPLEAFEGLDQLRNTAIATLIMHAPDDKEVSFAGAEILADAGEHVTLRPMPRLGHRRILYAKETAQNAAAFITQ
jgi:esterase/lipase